MAKKVVSYKCKLKNVPLAHCRVLQDTIVIYRNALSYIIDVVNKEWNDVELISTLKYCEHYIESLIHATKDNPSPKYRTFDLLFYKFPSYLRRNAIDEAIGAVSSYRSNLTSYEDERYYMMSNGQKFKKKPPKLNLRTNKFPALFRKNMFLENGRNDYSIKVYKAKDWVWLPVQVREQDLKYIEKNMKGLKPLAPSLVREDNSYKLSFPFEKKVDFMKEKQPQERKILAVDLGINTQATCCIMDGKGTILDRRFIKLSKETDRMHRLLNRLKRKYAESGTAKQKKLWSKINGYKKELANKTAHEVLNYALEHQVDVIVLENLSAKMGKAKKSKRDKIHHWNKREIIKKISTKAHFYGIRYALVNPKNTSALAFDGSGYVKRDKKNYSKATFTTGKQYNADLSASYNIGARYYIRAIKNATSEKKWSQFETKVHGLSRGTLCTLATFRSLLAVLCETEEVA